MATFRACLLHQEDDAMRPEVTDLEEELLPEEDVLIDVAFSSLNYKDGLAVTGRGKVIRAPFPFVPGIDLAGTVVDDRSGNFAAGEEVILTGWGTGEVRWGGFATRARCRPEHLVRLPDGMTPRQSMVVGTAGFTAMLAVMALEEHGLQPGAGEVVVTGASGGAGSVGVALLARLGHTVVASTGTEGAHEYLLRLGAHRIIDRDELGVGPSRPLEAARWAGAIDAVGGPTLASLLAETATHGSVAAFGNAQSHELHTTVFPFILRGVNLLGIDSNTCPASRRAAAWERLAGMLDDGLLATLHQDTIRLGQLPEFAGRITAGEILGRVVVDPHQP